MARLNITVPDDLYDKIQRWRERLNLSKICQEALAAEIAKLEAIPKAALEMEALVERLKREKGKAGRAWFRRGVFEGMEWGRRASYADLKRWGQAKPEELLKASSPPEVLRPYIRQHVKDPLWEYRPFAEGWLSGVQEVWRRVKDHV